MQSGKASAEDLTYAPQAPQQFYLGLALAGSCGWKTQQWLRAAFGLRCPKGIQFVLFHTAPWRDAKCDKCGGWDWIKNLTSKLIQYCKLTHYFLRCCSADLCLPYVLHKKEIFCIYKKKVGFFQVAYKYQCLKDTQIPRLIML